MNRQMIAGEAMVAVKADQRVHMVWHYDVDVDFHIFVVRSQGPSFRVGDQAKL